METHGQASMLLFDFQPVVHSPNFLGNKKQKARKSGSGCFVVARAFAVE